KIQGSTGAVLATFPVGDSPVGIVYDGQRIRVANSGSHTVSRLRVNDGVVVSTVQTGKGPFGLLWSGGAIWAANTGGDSVSTSAF
ncbi:MAG TPA: hypothetical protein VKF62_04735, partial [Planctomycetota bacterium]|nr:hypothetical protein [Planctomycetota bacterium]